VRLTSSHLMTQKMKSMVVIVVCLINERNGIFRNFDKGPADNGFDQEKLKNIGKASVGYYADVEPHYRLNWMHTEHD
jgi:hypothetical protein